MEALDKNIGKKLVYGLNGLWLIILVLIVLTPYLASISSPSTKYLYLLFRPTCHQMPQRSFFLWGHKMAVCARCTGTYISLLFCGIIFTLFLTFGKVKSISTIVFFIFLLPIAIDGGTQFVHLRESTNILRFVTGFFGGLGTIWFVYPRLWKIDEKNL
ncbi:DUF2085 domain-containing protein [bacterium]|nr:DUF2085 domain-containing protein [bacterium]